MNELLSHPLHYHLQAHPCFRVLSLEECAQLLRCARLQIFLAEETVFLEGETAVGLWWIESGTVKIYKTSPDGSEQILHLAGPGETFNDIAVYDNDKNPANVTTLTPAKLWLLPVEHVQTLLAQNNAFAQAVIHTLAQRIRVFTRQIEDLTLYSVTARLARFLLQQAENPSFAEAGVTRKAIASYLATTPESVSRTLRTLQEVGAIQFDRHRIMIVDEALLRSLAQIA